MSDDQPTLDAAFLDVRRSYRFLYSYQRRVRDLLQLIDGHLGRLGLEFNHWSPMWFSPPSRRSTAFFQPGAWAWDMLPGYAIETCWVSRVGKQEHSSRVFINVRADTGWAYGGGEPDAEAFAHVEDSRSVIEWGIWSGPRTDPDWGAALEALKQAGQFGKVGTHEASVGGSSYTYTYDVLDLAELPNADAVNRMVLAALEAGLKAGAR